MNKTFIPSNFTQREDGVYVATIAADAHGFTSDHFHMDRCMVMDVDTETWDNALGACKILTDRTFEFYVDEPGYYRLTLTQD